MLTETTFLTADTTLATGMASALCIGGGFYKFNTSRSRASADARAINNDWRMTGQDLARAMSEMQHKIPVPKQN